MSASRLLSALVVLLLVPGLADCGGGGSKWGPQDTTPRIDDGSPDPIANPTPQPPSPPSPPSPPPSGGTVTDQPSVPNGASPPVGVTWKVGITDDLSLSAMQSFAATFVSANNTLWRASEGQVRIDRVEMTDRVAPGVSAMMFMMGWGGVNTSGIDILAFPPSGWDVPASGAVGESGGRTGRIMVIPTNAKSFVLVHEGSHLLFRLTWSVGSLLVDEYQDGVQDAACIMESENTPLRWCSDANHVSQGSQPWACWRQILADYAAFRHTGADSTGNLPASPTFVYNDR